jgi:hypothetical protein
VATFTEVHRLIDPEAQPAFQKGYVNLVAAGVRVGEMNKQLAEAEALLADSYREDAHGRYEAATIAAASALLEIVGGSLTNPYKGRAHWAKKHFLVAALKAYGKRCPTLESVLVITTIRNIIDYDIGRVGDVLTPRSSDEARQACAIIKRSLLEILPASVKVPTFPTQKPGR